MMKLSSKIQKCGFSPMRKFQSYQVAAEARGLKIYHLNIGQPDIETPKVFFDTIREFRQPVLSYAPSPGVPAYLEAVKRYYSELNVPLKQGNILSTTGGS